MRAFSQLLDDLVYTRSRNSKLRLIGDYLKETPDPDRGLALAALTGTLDIPHIKPAAVRALAEERIDPVLLRMSPLPIMPGFPSGETAVRSSATIASTRT